MYSKISQTASNISLMVKKNEIISMINLSPEEIQIQADKVAITGFVTFSNLSTSGETTINGNNITTGTIKSTSTYKETNSNVPKPSGWSGNTVPVSWLEMNTGRFSFGKGGLYYNNGDLTINGDLYGTDWSITRADGFRFKDANKLLLTYSSGVIGSPKYNLSYIVLLFVEFQ